MHALKVLRTREVVFIGAILCVSLDANTSRVYAGDHYAHFNPADPRPDFFDWPLYKAWTPYRKTFNRPTYVGGHIAAVIEPTSQEAMAWKIANDKGDYKCNRPGYIPTYYYPKPWEALETEARSGDLQSKQSTFIQSSPGLATEPPIDVN